MFAFMRLNEPQPLSVTDWDIVSISLTKFGMIMLTDVLFLPHIRAASEIRGSEEHNNVVCLNRSIIIAHLRYGAFALKKCMKETKLKQQGRGGNCSILYE